MDDINNDNNDEEVPIPHGDSRSAFEGEFEGDEDLLAAAAALYDIDGDGDIDDEDARLASGSMPPPPPGAATTQTLAQEDRLTRDPFATFGGVLSGIAHRYGWDVAITRLAFVVLMFGSGGAAIPVYLLAWLIVPRAHYWPPVKRSIARLHGRDLGIAMLFFAAFLFLVLDGGRAASILVPLGLVGGGIWLLSQNPRDEQAPAFAGAAAATPPLHAPPPQDAVAYGQYQQQAPYAVPQAPSVAPQPVPQRRRRRGLIVGGLVAVLLVPIIVVGGFFALFSSGSFDVDFAEGSAVVERQFSSVSEIPDTIDLSSDGDLDLLVDLRSVDFSEATAADPVELEVRVETGRITVLVPEDVRAEVVAGTDFIGDVDAFGLDDRGLSPDVFVDAEDPQLILDLRVGLGAVEVIRTPE